MGSSSHHPKVSHTQAINNKKLDFKFVCPSCSKVLPKGTNILQFNTHVDSCFMSQEVTSSKQYTVTSLKKLTDFIYEQVPTNSVNHRFRWEKVAIVPINQDKLGKMQPKDVRKCCFQMKNAWFRQNLEKHRIPWEEGCDWMEVEKENVVMSSFSAAQKVNMHKEVKIDFIGEKVNDAGGLFREWMYLSNKEIFNQSLGIFARANTEEVMYKIRRDENLDAEFASLLFSLFGIIVGKAIFEKIPLESYLDRTILRRICGQPVQLEDIYGFDKQLYKSWKYLLDNKIDDLSLTFSIHRKREDGTVEEVQLIEGGQHIALTEQNKNIYVNLCIEHYCLTGVQQYLDILASSVHKIVPECYLNIFEPHELEMLIYGVPFVDVYEWKQHTEYRGVYSKTHKVIVWFWDTVCKFNQQQLAQLLHFTTGSSRTPIHGFKQLESNRGNYTKFLIESSAFEKANPYPKGHTCFNRLDLPLYPSQQLVRLYLEAIVNNDLDGIYGLD